MPQGGASGFIARMKIVFHPNSIKSPNNWYFLVRQVLQDQPVGKGTQQSTADHR